MRQWIRIHWKISLLVGLLLFGGGSFAMLEYTHQPKFCVSCHVMQPFYDAWETSSHSEVGCVECHYAPGIQSEIRGKLDALNQIVAYTTGSYNTKFYAEIEDASCLRSGCHDSQKLEGPIEFKQGIKFNHKGHYGESMRGIQLKCTSCHSQVVQGNHMAVTDVTCFLCHFRGRLDANKPQTQEFCLTCHDYPKADIQIGEQTYNHELYIKRGVPCQRCHIDAVRGDGHVEERACLQCHDDPEQLKEFPKVELIHKNHVTEHKVECFNCHAEIEHSVYTSTEPEEFNCTQCHTDTHLGPRELYSGTGGFGVDPMPAAMFIAQVDCIACHIDETHYGQEHAMKGTTMRPTVQGCIDCHGDTGREILEMWRELIAEEVVEGRKSVAAAQAVFAKADPHAKNYVRAEQMLGQAQTNVDFVEFGKGIHNVNYSMELIAKAQEFCETVIELLSE